MILIRRVCDPPTIPPESVRHGIPGGWWVDHPPYRCLSIALISLLACLAGAERSSADLVYFKKGGQAQLPVHRDGDRVILDVVGHPVEFVADDFKKIVPGFDPPAEWPSRLDAARKGDAAGGFAAAWWAIENGLTDEATALLAEVHAKDPAHRPTASLVATLTRIGPAPDDPELTSVRSSLSGMFRESRSPHFVVIHQSDDASARARLRLLEQVYTTYYLTLAARGLDLPAPRHRLVNAVFARQDDYLSFLRREHARGFSTSQAFYHPTRNVVVSFDPTDLPTQREAREAIELRRRSATGSGPRPEAIRRDLARQSLLLDLDRLAIEIGLTAHEAIHQLSANSGLAPHHDDFPIWLHEGFASQFEVVRGGRWSGVGRAHDIRLPDWRSIAPPPRLAPIVRDEGYGLGYRRDLYAGAWALVYYLRKEHPEEFTHFLDRLRQPSTSPAPPTRVLDAFRSSFGDDLSRIESDWHRFLRTTKSPLEEGAEPPARPELRPSRN